MASSKPVIIIASGGWHVPVSYSKLTNALEADGFEVRVPPLPSMSGGCSKDLDDDTECIRSVAEKLVYSGRSVIAMGHSYGGQVISNALYGLGKKTRSEKNLEGGVTDLIYLTALALPENWSMINQVFAMGHGMYMKVAYEYHDDGTIVDRNPRPRFVAECEDDDEAQSYLNTLVSWGSRPLYMPILHAAWREIPVTYVHGTLDNTVPLAYQTDMVARLRAEGAQVKTAALEAGHCANFTRPKEVAEIVKRVANGTLEDDGTSSKKDDLAGQMEENKKIWKDQD
ncbi:alpha/beta-hydrolase [Xylariaceae sp. FL0016]|nr:alpha/beta-hydrolase [Xylariaceae sp. FL0016]